MDNSYILEMERGFLENAHLNSWREKFETNKKRPAKE